MDSRDRAPGNESPMKRDLEHTFTDTACDQGMGNVQHPTAMAWNLLCNHNAIKIPSAEATMGNVLDSNNRAM